VERQTQLLHVVRAAHAASSFASGLNRWQQQPHQDTDDGNHHQQFYQRKTGPNTVPHQ
jgi:hypothetical protein